MEKYKIEIRIIDGNGRWWDWSRGTYKTTRRVLQALNQFKANEALSRWWKSPKSHLITNYEYRIVHAN